MENPEKLANKTQDEDK